VGEGAAYSFIDQFEGLDRLHALPYVPEPTQLQQGKSVLGCLPY